MIPQQPHWVELLWGYRRANNTPTLREIENRSGIPRSTLSRYFRGTTLPKQEDVMMLMSVLDVGEVGAAEMLGLVRAARIEQRRVAGLSRKPPQPEPSTARDGDSGALVEAINRLAAAIEKLAER